MVVDALACRTHSAWQARTIWEDRVEKSIGVAFARVVQVWARWPPKRRKVLLVRLHKQKSQCRRMIWSAHHTLKLSMAACKHT